MQMMHGHRYSISMRVSGVGFVSEQAVMPRFAEHHLDAAGNIIRTVGEWPFSVDRDEPWES